MNDRCATGRVEPAAPVRAPPLPDAAGGGGAGSALSAGMYAKQASALPARPSGPPGALPEDDFPRLRALRPVRARLSRKTLKLADVRRRVATARRTSRRATSPARCARTSPASRPVRPARSTRALTDITKAKMGLAVLIDQENCLNFLGLRCDVCYRVCPVIDKAITLEKRSTTRATATRCCCRPCTPTHCTGCGKCEKACVLPGEAAIKVLPDRWRKRRRPNTTAWLGAGAGGRFIGDQVAVNRPRGPEGRPATPFGRTRARAGPARRAGAGLRSRRSRRAVVSTAGGPRATRLPAAMNAGSRPPACAAPRARRDARAGRGRWRRRAGGAHRGCCCVAVAARHPGAVLAGPLGVVDRQGQPVVQPSLARAAAHRPLPGRGQFAAGHWPGHARFRRRHRRRVLSGLRWRGCSARGCAWSTFVTDAAAPGLRWRLGLGGRRAARYWLLGFRAGHRGGDRPGIGGVGQPVSMFHRGLIFGGPPAWGASAVFCSTCSSPCAAGAAPVPQGAFYALLADAPPSSRGGHPGSR